MEAIKQMKRVPKSRELRIKLPDHFPEDELVEVLVIIRKKDESFREKIAHLKKAKSDEAFWADVKEVANDFHAVDSENWE